MTLFGFSGVAFGVTLMAIIGCFDYASQQLGSVLVFAGVVANFCNTFQASTSYAYLTEMPDQRYRARSVGWGLGLANWYVSPPFPYRFPPLCWYRTLTLSFAVMFQFVTPFMLKVWVVKTAWLFVGLGIP
jgi:hypothetical protein